MKNMINEKDSQKPEYAKFWIRAGAYITDLIAVSVVTIPITYYNITEIKSFFLYLIIAIIGISYKPLMEYYFSATLGKIALDLKVVDLDYNKISLQQSFLRSSILLLPMILYIPLYYFVFNNPNLMSINSFMDFTKQITVEYPFTQNMISKLSTIIIILEIVFLLTDKSKTERALHDRIGKTYVIKTKK